MIELTHTIDAGHRIVGHKGKCARLHGHTYRFEIRLHAEELKDPGFIADFGDVKDILNEWDHRMILWSKDPFQVSPGIPPDVDMTIEQWMDMTTGVIRVNFNPTAENMAWDTAVRLVNRLDVDGAQVKVWETPKAYAYASFYKADPENLPKWWNLP